MENGIPVTNTALLYPTEASRAPDRTELEQRSAVRNGGRFGTDWKFDVPVPHPF